MITLMTMLIMPGISIRARQFMGGNGGGLSEMMQNPELMDRYV
jgi:hypothetical protein